MGKRSKPLNEQLPWYRANGYDGNMSEHEKRVLDSFRLQRTHPAASYDSLPAEVQSYISNLELTIYDNKQDALAYGCLVVSGIGALNLYQGYFEDSVGKLAVGTLLFIVPWIYYRFAWKKNAEAFHPSEAPRSATDEALIREWELEYLTSVKRL